MAKGFRGWEPTRARPHLRAQLLLFAATLALPAYACASDSKRAYGADEIFADSFEFDIGPIGAQDNPARSCRDIQLNRIYPPADGTYYLIDGVDTFAVPCDMTLDGGGWTASFSGQNGSSNVFDHFDAGVYTGAHQNPTGQYLRRAPAFANESAAEFAVSCGSAAVAFALTEATRNWLRTGTQRAWVAVTPRVLAGSVVNVPNSIWTGMAADTSFIATLNQNAFGSTFGSSYSGGTAFNFCNGVADSASPLRVLLREVVPTPVLNVPAAARRSCAELRADGNTQDGSYWLQQAPGPPYRAYCDMNLAGGGWTAVYSGRNGTANVFDAFDAGVHQGICPDPASRCLRRAPADIGDSATEIALACGGAAVAFPLTSRARQWLELGVTDGWLPVQGRTISGSVAAVPNSLYSGVVGDPGFILARNQGAGSSTFATSYPGTDSYSSCNGVYDAATIARLYYREALVAPALNQPAQAGSSCKALRDGGATMDGNYWVLVPAAGPALTYCDMSHDGGGWTAIFSGRNGSPHVFDRFDAGIHTGICTDPQTRCLRRAPAGLATGEFAVACGAAFVKFPLTATAAAYFGSGTQVGWTAIAPVVVAGSVINVPNTLFTGAGSTRGWIFARNQGAAANTFAQSFDANASFDYCNGALDTQTIARIYYREN